MANKPLPAFQMTMRPCDNVFMIRYEGRLCKTCSAGFGRVKAADCAECPSLAQNLAVTSTVSIGIAAGVTFVIAQTVRNAGADHLNLAPQVQSTHVYSLWLRCAKPFRGLGCMAQMFKVFWTHVQLASFQLLYNLPWPESVIVSVCNSAAFCLTGHCCEWRRHYRFTASSPLLPSLQRLRFTASRSRASCRRCTIRP